jgi:hypothetical protein
MSTFTTVNTYTHSVTYVANKLLQCLKDIVRLSGLNPEKLTNDWTVLERGIAKWLETKHLESVTLEVYNPTTDALVGRWDLEISYGWNGGDGAFWIDTEQIKYHIIKQGILPSSCDYRVVVHNKTGRPDVAGWSSTAYRSTDGFVRQSLGTTLDASGLGTSAAYYRRK